MRVGILQPGYLPWLGFFEQIYRSDIFVIYDDVQYDKHGWRNRNRIKTHNGFQWLTVPVIVSNENPSLIKDVRIDNKKEWRQKHLSSLRQNYSKAYYFKEHRSLFEDAYTREWEYLVDIDMHFISRICKILGMADKKLVRSSELNITGGRTERLINICKLFNADVFYEGASGRSYINEADFINHGIKVEFQDYKHPVYKQLYGEFVSHMSIVDLLFNEGNRSLSILAGINI